MSLYIRFGRLVHFKPTEIPVLGHAAFIADKIFFKIRNTSRTRPWRGAVVTIYIILYKYVPQKKEEKKKKKLTFVTFPSPPPSPLFPLKSVYTTRLSAVLCIRVHTRRQKPKDVTNFFFFFFFFSPYTHILCSVSMIVVYHSTNRVSGQNA